MADELKPCPFCGAPGEIEHGSDHHGAWFNLGCSRHWGHVRDPNRSNTCIAGRMFYTETDVPETEAIDAWNTRASVRAAAMSDLIAGDADLYDTPSARITGDKDRENPVEGAQLARRILILTEANRHIAIECIGLRDCLRHIADAGYVDHQSGNQNFEYLQSLAREKL